MNWESLHIRTLQLFPEAKQGSGQPLIMIVLGNKGRSCAVMETMDSTTEF